VKRYLSESIYKGFKEIPSWPFLGHITYFWNSNHDEAMVGIANDVMEGSDSFVYRNILSNQKSLVVQKLEWLKSIFTNTAVFQHTGLIGKFQPLVLKSLICSDGKVHHWQKMILSRAFTPDSFRGYMPIMHEYSKLMCNKWKSLLQSENQNGFVEVEAHFKDVTSDIIGDVAFGYKFGNVLATVPTKTQLAMRTFLESGEIDINTLILLRPIMPLIMRLPFGPGKKKRESDRIMRDLLTEIVNKGVNDLNDGNATAESKRTILGILLRAAQEDERMTADMVMSNIILFMIAGHETTAKSLTWCLYALAHNPDAQEKARNEIGDIVIGDTEASLEEINNLNYLNNVCKETLRMYPIVNIVNRTLGKNASVPEGPFLKKGTQLTTFIPALHYSEENFPEPHKFKPERFDDKDAIKALSWLPFGYGAYDCIGKKFAMLEMKVILSHILQMFRIEPDPNFKDFKVSYLVTRNVSPALSVKLVPIDN